METSILPVIKELEKIYTYFIPKFGQDLLSIPMPRIVVQSTGKKEAYGWYSANRWKSKEDETNLLHEITITAEYLEKGVEEVAHTMLHEMCHLDNYVNEIKDCNPGGYHNAKFKLKAEFVGLKVEKVRVKGWSRTHLTDKLKEEIQLIGINEQVFQCFRLRDKKKTNDEAKKDKVYSCSCTKIRCSKEVDATCNMCGNYFREVFKLKLD